jgi:outer membrane protein assembly factor BamC
VTPPVHGGHAAPTLRGLYAGRAKFDPRQTKESILLRRSTNAPGRTLARSGAAWLCSGAILLGGCSWLHFGEGDDTYDYRKSTPKQQPLEVPPDLSQLPKDEHLSLPGAGSKAAAPAVATAGASAAAAQPNAPAVALVPAGAAPGPAPAASQAVAISNGAARIVHDGNQRWLEVDASPELVYTAIKELWSGQGMKLAIDEPAVGLLETEWVESRPEVNEDAIRNGLHKVLGAFDSNGLRDKYRAFIERTSRDTSVVTISHSGLAEVYDSPNQDRTKWQARAPQPELAAAMLQRLALRFVPLAPLRVAVASPGAPSSAAPAAPPAAPVLPEIQSTRAHQVTSGGNVSLLVEDSVERTWRRIGIALDRKGFTIEERKRDKYSYTVRYLDPDYEVREKEKRGWWDRIFNSDAKVPEQQFLIVASADGANTAVMVQDKEGRPDNRDTARHILDQLTEALR